MSEPVGVVLAGGLGRRIGGEKAAVSLAGKPLLSYPLAAMQSALGDVAVLAKADSRLPEIPGMTVWVEADTTRHPLVGILQALALAEGRPVLICAGDLPFVTPELVHRLARTSPRRAPAVVAAHGDAIQPLLGCYQQTAAAFLSRADVDLPLREAIAALRPRLLEVGDPNLLFNVNTPDDLLQATAMLGGSGTVGREGST